MSFWRGYSYDAAGRATVRADPSSLGGATWSRAYEDATGRLDSQTIVRGSQTLVSSALAYDPAGNVTSKTQQIQNADSPAQMISDDYTFTYDGANRMITEAGPGPTRTYAYDGLGNRVSTTKSGATESFIYDGAGMPVSSDEETPASSGDDTP